MDQITKNGEMLLITCLFTWGRIGDADSRKDTRMDCNVVIGFGPAEYVYIAIFLKNRNVVMVNAWASRKIDYSYADKQRTLIGTYHFCLMHWYINHIMKICCTVAPSGAIEKDIISLKFNSVAITAHKLIDIDVDPNAEIDEGCDMSVRIHETGSITMRKMYVINIAIPRQERR